MSAEASVELYNTARAQADTGIFLPGLDEVDAMRAAQDEQSIVIPNTRVPLAVLPRNHRWIREEYFEGKLTSKQRNNMLYYSGWPSLASEVGADPDATIDHLVSEVVARGATLVFEQSYQRDVKAELEASIQRTNVQGYDYPELTSTLAVPGRDEITIRPEHYVYISRYTGVRESDEPAADNYYDAYAARYSDDEATQLIDELPQQYIEATYPHYQDAFTQVTEHDPIPATLNDEEYEAVMTDPRFLKFVEFDDNGVANMFVVGDIQDCDWMSQQVFANGQYAEAYQQRLLKFSAGAYSRPGTPPGLLRKTVAAAAKAFDARGERPITVGEFNGVSNLYIPRIFVEGTKDSGVLEITVGEPDVVQSVMAWAPAR